MLQVLKEKWNWKTVKKYSFEINPRIYSFLWRFQVRPAEAKSLIRNLTSLGTSDARKVRKVAEKYHSYLQQKLVRGMVFLVPDAKLDFHCPSRLRKPYARPVLVFDVRADQLIIIPFSTKINRMNNQMDILFDQSYRGKALDPEDLPAVENFPYTIFTRKNALIVSAYQPISRDDFLSSALVHLGQLRVELLKFVEYKMKIVGG